MKKYIIFGIAALALTSCNDFLDREPLDFGSSDSYYKTENDLKIAANAFYEMLPLNSVSNTGLYTEDLVSDNMCSPQAQDLLYLGNKRVVDIDNSPWNFSSLRGVNFFLQKVEENKNSLMGSQEYLNHYIGEAHFFRAYAHFELMRNFGDIPILTKMLSDNHDELVEASKRYPRNEVARFILSELDQAAELMMENPIETGRLTKDAAYALKSRVALYEATWEKYHAGTCFVPGNSKWVGKDTWPEFSWPLGSAEAEINYFLEQCIDASEKAVANHPLYDDYLALFNSVDVSGMPEVIFARYYMSGAIAHSCSYFMRNGGGRGITRQAVHTYLMQNGLPVYANNSGFQGDETVYDELTGRDPRLTGERDANGMYPRNPNPTANHYFRGFGIVRPAGFIQGETPQDTIFYYKPYIHNSGNEKAPTGYEVNKWVSEDPDQQLQGGTTTAVPLFRSAECMLNYLEAYYLRYNNLGGNCDTYWKALRARAGVDTDYQKTIQNTDLAQEMDFGVWSKKQEIDKTLYNIRRERRCELIAEGRRTDDLKRWRSFDSMESWQPEGMKLYPTMSKMYTATELNNGISSEAISDYIHPLQATETNNAYNGYTFPGPHYLEPIPISEFALTTTSNGKSIIYQNPGWPTNTVGIADYSYDCD